MEQYQPGDEVFGEDGNGGFAEYVCVDENRFVQKPANLAFEETAAIPIAALTTLIALAIKDRLRWGKRS